MKYFEYKVLFYDENYEQEMLETGIVAAESYSAATSKVEKTFLNDLIEVSLYETEDTNCFVLSGKYFGRIAL